MFNFSAGPSMLPIEVIRQIKEEFIDICKFNKPYIMEISHRSKEFIGIAKDSEIDLRNILNVPKNYKILFCQGGARLQFAAVPLNFFGSFDFRQADYINSGYWSYYAALEAQKYCNTRIINVKIKINNILSIKSPKYWPLSSDSAYVHYCPNETIDGILINEIPAFCEKILVGDFSSILLAQPLDIKRFGIIYAAAQKNIGLAGLTLIIIRDDLLNHACQELPSTLNYQILAEHNSMFNTPPTFPWYVASLIFKWIKFKGGLSEIYKYNKVKSDLLYNIIDKSDLYFNNIAKENRSFLNIPFNLINNKLNQLFIEQSLDEGLYGLKGHKIVGGMRASLYNAMTLDGVKVLVEFMQYFAKKYG